MRIYQNTYTENVAVVQYENLYCIILVLILSGNYSFNGELEVYGHCSLTKRSRTQQNGAVLARGGDDLSQILGSLRDTRAERC